MPSLYTCYRGFTVAVVRVQDQVVRINGVIEQSSNTAKPEFKKSHKDRKIKRPELERWVFALGVFLPKYEQIIQEEARESIYGLHDIKALIGSILRTSELWVSAQTGMTMDDKIDNSPDNLRKIYQACRVLESLLQTIDIMANPEVARFGTPRALKVVNVLFLLHKIHEDKAANRNIDFRFRGNSQNVVYQYSSFIVVPHILIDNAIKHSQPRSQIHISCEDAEAGGVHVDISSQGRIISLADRKRIFQRSSRGGNVTVRGSGLGLYIAHLVAEVNGFSISYQPEPFENSEERGYNHFCFTVPNRAPTSGEGT